MTLTHEEIDALQAGAETDRLVAEKVMGYAYSNAYSMPQNDDIFYKFPDEMLYRFRPSTDANDTLKVEQKLSKDGWMFHAEHEAGEWFALFWRDNVFGEIDDHIATADTLPLATSRAALKVVMG